MKLTGENRANVTTQLHVLMERFMDGELDNLTLRMSPDGVDVSAMMVMARPLEHITFTASVADFAGRIFD